MTGGARITVEEGLRDFRESGLIPVPYDAVRDGRYGCLIGAMYVARGGEVLGGRVLTITAQCFLKEQGFSWEYIGGLVRGFDTGHALGLSFEIFPSDEYNAGALVGSEVRERLGYGYAPGEEIEGAPIHAASLIEA